MSERADKAHALAGEILDVVLGLWPKPHSGSTIQVEAHQWKRIRRVLLATVDYLVEDSVPGARPASLAAVADEPTVVLSAVPVQPQRPASRGYTSVETWQSRLKSRENGATGKGASV